MTLQEKRRVLSVDHLDHINWTRDTRVPGYQQYFEEHISVFSHQITRSEGHGWPKGRSVRDVGGPFDTVKLTYEQPQKGTYEITRRPFTFTEEYRRSSWVPYSVGFYGSPFNKEFPTFEECAAWVSPTSSRTNLTSLGSKLISQTLPTNPVVDGSVSLAELFREGIPSMFGAALDIRNKVAFFRSLGPEYLNYEFGWKPLVSSFLDAAKAVTESEKILTNLAKHSGKELRRHRLLPMVRETDIQVQDGINPTWMPGSWISPAARLSTTTTTTRKQSFSGCYTYHYDPGQMNEVSRIATQARLLYGLELTPEVLWNLAPWSWLVDWFANVGPLLHNVSSFQSDGLVMKYGYVMEEVTRTIRRSNRANVFIGSHPSTVVDEFHGTWKRREQASPYGFGLNSIDFTNRQWAILGALGLTLAPGNH